LIAAGRIDLFASCPAEIFAACARQTEVRNDAGNAARAWRKTHVDFPG